jgi:hypothetical protein
VSSALRTGRLYSQEFSWYSFLEAESTPGHMVPSLASEKIPSDTTGDRSRDLSNFYLHVQKLRESVCIVCVCVCVSVSE